MSNADEPGTRMTNPGTHQAGSQRPRAANRAGSAKSAGKSRGRHTGLSTAAILGFSAALITFVLDQATKLYTLFVYDLPVKEPAEVLPFINLIVGGALGNVVDRIWHGAVFDFIQFHVGSWSWYVFNVADAAIVAGVAGLLYDSFVLEGRRAKS